MRSHSQKVDPWATYTTKNPLHPITAAMPIIKSPQLFPKHKQGSSRPRPIFESMCVSHIIAIERPCRKFGQLTWYAIRKKSSTTTTPSDHTQFVLCQEVRCSNSIISSKLLVVLLKLLSIEVTAAPPLVKTIQAKRQRKVQFFNTRRPQDSKDSRDSRFHL